jgi:hypothetical protein
MFIEPKDLIYFNLFDLNKADQIIQVGYEYGVSYLLENPDLIKEDALLKRLKVNIKQFIKR